MYPHERSLVKRMEGKPFALIGVNSDDNRDKLKPAMAANGITWRSFWNGGGTSGPISQAWHLRGWPSLWLIDHKGIIRRTFVGYVEPNVMDQAVEELVKEAEAGK
jgi:hypothetical protein